MQKLHWLIFCALVGIAACYGGRGNGFGKSSMEPPEVRFGQPDYRDHDRPYPPTYGGRDGRIPYGESPLDRDRGYNDGRGFGGDRYNDRGRHGHGYGTGYQPRIGDGFGGRNRRELGHGHEEHDHPEHSQENKDTLELRDEQVGQDPFEAVNQKISRQARHTHDRYGRRDDDFGDRYGSGSRYGGGHNSDYRSGAIGTGARVGYDSRYRDTDRHGGIGGGSRYRDSDRYGDGIGDGVRYRDSDRHRGIGEGARYGDNDNYGRGIGDGARYRDDRYGNDGRYGSHSGDARGYGRNRRGVIGTGASADDDFNSNSGTSGIGSGTHVRKEFGRIGEDDGIGGGAKINHDDGGIGGGSSVNVNDNFGDGIGGGAHSRHRHRRHGGHHDHHNHSQDVHHRGRRGGIGTGANVEHHHHSHSGIGSGVSVNDDPRQYGRHESESTGIGSGAHSHSHVSESSNIGSGSHIRHHRELLHSNDVQGKLDEVYGRQGKKNINGGVHYGHSYGVGHTGHVGPTRVRRNDGHHDKLDNGKPHHNNYNIKY